MREYMSVLWLYRGGLGAARMPGAGGGVVGVVLCSSNFVPPKGPWNSLQPCHCKVPRACFSKEMGVCIGFAINNHDTFIFSAAFLP